MPEIKITIDKQLKRSFQFGKKNDNKEKYTVDELLLSDTEQ